MENSNFLSPRLNMRLCNKNKLNKILIITIVLLITCILESNAVVINPRLTITNDINGDGIIGIGDSITFSCISTNASAGFTPYVDLTQLGNSFFYLPNVVSNFHSAIFSANVPRNIDGILQPYFFDNDGMFLAANSVIIDLQPPICPNGIVLDPTAPTGTGGIYRLGDRLRFNMQFTDADAVSGNPDRLTIWANLTNLGLGNNVPLTRGFAGAFFLDIGLLPNRERNADTFEVVATDDAGNRRVYVSAISYDTRPPNIQSCNLINLSGRPYVKAGDRIRLTAIINNYDYDRCYASSSYLLSNEEEMNLVSVTGTTATFEFEIVVATGTNIDSNFIRFQVRAVDDAGNESTRYSNALAFDTIPPGFNDANIEIIERGGVTGDLTAIIGDTLRIYGNLSQIFNDVTLTVDLSPIGGVTNQIVPITPGSTTFELLFDVFTFTSENNIPRMFTLRAEDKANNVVYTYTLPVIYVDNRPPTISGGQIQKVSATPGPAKLGDVIAIQANVTNLDGGSIWVDLSQLGGPASAVLQPYGGATYRVEHTINIPMPPANAIDTSRSYRIFVIDDAGNIAFTDTNSLSIDNEPPVITAATYTVSPPISPSHPYVRVGDSITFRVSVASCTSTPYDGVTVTMDLSALGGSSNQTLVYDGVGTFTYTLTVQSGSLNNDSVLVAVARDNAGNVDSRPILVRIDNFPPVVGPMTVNYLRDVNRTGVVNVGDRLEFIVPVSDPDYGTCTIDLSLIGGPSAYIMNYDPTLSRYYLIYDCTTSTVEIANYVFRAVVTDKAGNSMNSLSAPFNVDCVPPEIIYASATIQNLFGNANVGNVGDRIIINALVDLAKLDGGIPTVNLSTIGGNSNQALYDDGAHEDGAPNDGLFGYVQTINKGNIDGMLRSFAVYMIDNAGNSTYKNTESIFIDNKPIEVSTFSAQQIFDNNGNTIVDLDGYYTTYPQVATDVVQFNIILTGNTSDFSNLTIDLRPLGYNNPAYPLTVTPTTTGWSCIATFSPIPGNTNRQSVYFYITVTDVNGNITNASSSSPLLIDNKPPSVTVYPVSWLVDNGRLNEANEGDVIRIKVRCQDHDGILPQLDLTNLYLDNGLPPPSPIFFPPGGPNEYTVDWTVPSGLGSISSLTILVYDSSGNQTVGYTTPIRFLSKKPIIAPYPSTVCELVEDKVPDGSPNRIANAPDSFGNKDRVKITVVLTSAYNVSNNPPAPVLVDVRSIISDPADDENPNFYDGNLQTYWASLNYVTAISSGGPFVYSKTFDVGRSNTDVSVASFVAKVCHPDTYAITISSATVICNPSNQFGIDTQVPYFSNLRAIVVDEKNDNISSDALNIGDIIRIVGTINDFTDPGSATAILYNRITGEELIRTQLSRFDISNDWEAYITVGTGAESIWPKIDRAPNNLRIDFIVSDDANNFGPISSINPATFTIDNVPPQIRAAEVLISSIQNPQNWIANIGDGYLPPQGDFLHNDSIIASVTIATHTDLLGNGRAWIDLSAILGTTTYPINQTPVGMSYTRNSLPFMLSTQTIDLATYTFRIWVRDPSGNKAFTDVLLAVDTTRPRLVVSEYNGEILTLRFSENIDLETNITTSEGIGFDKKLVRIGRQPNNTLLLPDRTIALSDDDIILDNTDSSTINIQLSSNTKALIADWGRTNLYLSLGFNTSNGEAPAFDMRAIASDVAGNWLSPIPHHSPISVTITQDYASRPRLIRGYYRADNPTDAQFLYLEFDKDMDLTTIGTHTLHALAIWKNKANPEDNYSNRYRFYWSAANDAVAGMDSSRRIILSLSQHAQDWIAMNFGRNANTFFLQIDDNSPPLIRDFNGNRVMPLPYNLATAGLLIPLRSNFSIQQTKLDLSGAYPILSIYFQTSPDVRRVRLYNDGYKPLRETIELSMNLPIDLSKVYLYRNADGSGGYFALTTSMVDYNVFKLINTDFASNAVHIPLKPEALQTLLSWGTQNFHIACEFGAFKDLWGNDSLRHPVIGVTAAPINTIVLPSGFGPASIQTLAMAPLIDPARHTLGANAHLLKGFEPNMLTFEVTFNTPIISGNVYIPIDRNQIPELNFFTEDGTPIDVPVAFVGWFEQRMGPNIYTGARFRNDSSFISGNLQRVPTFVQVRNFRHIFWNGSLGSETATLTYNLIDKDETNINGFRNNPRRPYIDNRPPNVLSVSPEGVIGVMPANIATFSVTFDEPMDTTSGVRPSLVLKQGGITVMTFTFDRWDADTRKAWFRNNLPFNESTPQGPAQYEVVGGRDEATNNHNRTTIGSVVIRSRGPVINTVNIRTIQSTVNPNEILLNQPFSPYVSPSIATISVTLESSSIATPARINFFDGATNLGSISMKLDPVSGNYIAEWDGNLDLLPVSKRTKQYELRFYDIDGNEASRRATIIYDGEEPNVQLWRVANLASYSNKVYFSPSTKGFAKIDIFGPTAAQTLRLAVSNIIPPIATNAYFLSPLAGGGYTISWDGRTPPPTSSTLPDGEYSLYVVDLAGNVSTPTPGAPSSLTMVIDNTKPQDIVINTFFMGNPVSRFNPNVGSLTIQIQTTDLTLADGGSFVRIYSGGSIVRTIRTEGSLPNLIATWDGKDSNNNLVADGIYRIKVIDLAENESDQYIEINVVTSPFRISTAQQIDKYSVKVAFTHDVSSTSAVPGNFVLLSSGVPAIMPTSTNVSGNEVELVFPSAFVHNRLYIVEAAIGLLSVDGATIQAGYNRAQFIADTQPPTIVNHSYDGITQQNQVNIIFSETVTASSATNIGNYKLTQGTETLVITNITMLADNKSVRITSQQNLLDGVIYTLSASGVEDLYRNQSSGDVAKINFSGQDLTPPVIKVSVTSNPANEHNIVILVLVNEILGEPPTAVITQSGAPPQTITLNAGPTPYLYIGGVLLDRNKQGVAVIKVTAKDVKGNTSSTTTTFTIAVVNANVKAKVFAPDNKFAVIINEDTLKEQALVKIVSETYEDNNLNSLSLRQNLLNAINNYNVNSSIISFNLLHKFNLPVVSELVPISNNFYNVYISQGKAVKSFAVEYLLDSETINSISSTSNNIIFYLLDHDGIYKPIISKYSNNSVIANTMLSTSYIVYKDVASPKINLTLSKTNLKENLKLSEIPEFKWSVVDYGSGVDENSVYVLLNNNKYKAIHIQKGVFSFDPKNYIKTDGNYSIQLKAKDLAGNVTITPSMKFAVQVPFEIYEIVQYPNPAKDRLTLRVVTNKQISEDYVSVDIYDIAGYKVVSKYDLQITRNNELGRVIHNIHWDLRNKYGNKVANGVYIAKISIIDPDTGLRKVKVKHKLAVLR